MSIKVDGKRVGDPGFDVNRGYTVHIDGEVRFSLMCWFDATDDPDIDFLVQKLSCIDDLPDSRATWHRNTLPLEKWFFAHVLRECRGLSIKGLADYFERDIRIPWNLGFEKTVKGEQFPRAPSYTQLRDIWEETFTPRHRGACKVIAEWLVDIARDKGIPAPEDVFVPEPTDSSDETDDEPTVRELTIEKTGDVWQHIRPMVLNHWELKRHHNWEVPDPVFFDGHAYLATESDDVFPESGLGNMDATGEHDHVHYPSTHREQLKRFNVEEIRSLLQSVNSDLVREARREGELVGELAVAIDQTKGHPWTGEIERDKDGENVEPWILGYKNDNDTRAQYYFQWATVQVVGLDIPLVLDAIPVKRGMTKAEIVDELLATATDLVDDIEIVLMDAGFDSEATKDSVEKHGLYYLNRKSRDPTDKRQMRQMWTHDETTRIVDHEHRVGMPTRKTVYVPRITFDEDEDEDENGERSKFRQQLIREFGGGLEDEMDERSPFKQLLSDVHETEAPDEELDAGEVYVPFETNHPLADKRAKWEREEIPEAEQLQASARMIRLYDNRWGVENGYKKIGQFLPRSGSKNHNLRFFGFAFACTLYNAWRLVDLLVKLTVEDDPEYTPIVTASRFLAVAEGQFGLKPPPD